MNRFVSADIRRRLFMIFDKDRPYQIKHVYKLEKPKIVFSHIQVIPGPQPGCIPIFKTQTTDFKYYRFESLMSAARFAKKLRTGKIPSPCDKN